jgi:hypothetical protein
MGRFKLSGEEREQLKKALIDFCLRCMEPKKYTIAGWQGKATEGELAILPQMLEALFR